MFVCLMQNPTVDTNIMQPVEEISTQEDWVPDQFDGFFSNSQNSEIVSLLSALSLNISLVFLLLFF